MYHLNPLCINPPQDVNTESMLSRCEHLAAGKQKPHGRGNNAARIMLADAFKRAPEVFIKV